MEENIIRRRKKRSPENNEPKIEQKLEDIEIIANKIKKGELKKVKNIKKLKLRYYIKL